MIKVGNNTVECLEDNEEIFIPSYIGTLTCLIISYYC